MLSGSAASTPRKSVFQQAIESNMPRTNWTREEIKEIYDMPLMELAFAAVRPFFAMTPALNPVSQDN
jgi:hypothetical protein